MPNMWYRKRKFCKSVIKWDKKYLTYNKKDVKIYLTSITGQSYKKRLGVQFLVFLLLSYMFYN